MDKKSKEIYSELDAYLKCIDKSKRDKIPADLLELIKSKKDDNYNPQYPKEASIEKIKIKKETVDMINLLNFNYWCNSEKDRKDLLDKIANRKKEEKLKYSAFDKIKNIFKKKN